MIALVLALSIGPLLVAAGPARGASKSFDLYGNGTTGWGFTSGGESIPGPTMTVDKGDSVTMHLFSEDSAPHQFHVDYDGDGATDPGEPVSDVFTSSTTYMFTADTAGSFTYRCTVHPSMMYGTWNTQETAVHDVAITFVTTDKVSVFQGDTVTISVTVENQGTVSDTTVVTAFAGTTAVGSKSVTLAAGESQTPTFAWDTTSYAPGDYVVHAEASVVPGETDTGDNSLTDGTVTVSEPPPPHGDLQATLVGRSAWPDFHHLSVVRRGSAITFFGKIANIGPGPVNAKVVFTVQDGAGNPVATVESNVATISVDAQAVVSGTWITLAGRFRVVAQCWFDSNGDGSFDTFDANTKEFGFAVVP